MLNRLTIKGRIYFINIAILLLFVIMALFSVRNSNGFKELGLKKIGEVMLKDQKARIKLATHTAALMVEAAIRGLDDNEQVKAIIRSQIDNIIYELDRSGYFFVYKGTVNIAFPVDKARVGMDLGSVTDKNGVRVIQALRDAAKSGGGYVNYVWPKPHAGDQPKISYAEMIPGTDMWIGTGVYIDNIDALLSQEAEDFARLNFKRTTTMFAVSGIIFAAIIILFLFIAFGIGRSLKELIFGFQDIAEGEGDLTKRLPMNQVNCSKEMGCNNKDCPEYGRKSSCWDTVGSNAIKVHCPKILSGTFASCHECHVLKMAVRNETDEMKSWFNTFIGRIHNIVTEVSHNAKNVKSASSELSGIAARMSAGASETSQRTSTVSAAAEEMSANLTNVAAAMEQSSTNASMVASAAEEMTATIHEIADNTRRASSVSKDATDKSQGTSVKMSELDQLTQTIGKVTETITEISEQTNLLALNATIEAARAGEAGKGFAVVANEIKELAKQTADATQDIRKQIGSVQNTTGSTVSDINGISEVIASVNDIVATIAAAVEEQSTAAGQIAANIAQTSQGIQEVNENVAHSSIAAEEISKNMTEINQKTLEMTSSSEQVETSAADLLKMSGQLNEIVGRFKI